MDVPVFAEGTKVRWMGFAGVVTLRWMGVACVEFTPPGGETYAHVLWKLHRYSPVVPE